MYIILVALYAVLLPPVLIVHCYVHSQSYIEILPFVFVSCTVKLC